MAKDLTSSRIDRQNILNNELALQEIQDSSNIRGIVFEGKICLSKLAIGTPSTNQQIHTDRPPLNCRDLLQKTA